MNIFVTGASGFVGHEIVKRLCAEGRSVRILAREPYSERVQRLMEQYRVEVQTGDVLDADALRKGASGMHAVVHLVGIISEFGPNTFENVHTRGTEQVLSAAKGAGIERFVHMSALGTRPTSRSRYHQTKWLAEEAVRQSDLDYTIFRPSLIFGRGDQFVTLFSKLIKFSPLVPLMTDRRARFQPVALEQVAEAFTRSVMEPKSIGETYDLCGPDLLTLEDIVNAICDAQRRKRLKWRVPSGLSQALAKGLEFVYPRVLKRASPLNRDQLLMLQEDNIGDPKAANQLFDLTPIPFRKGLERIME